MSEIRQDWLLGHRVIMAPERAARPFEHSEMPLVQPLSQCPFCRGHEAETPNSVLELSAVGARTGDWSVRVIANRYPALSDQQVVRPTVEPSAHAQVQPGMGRHEVIVEAPEHATSLAHLSNEQFGLIALSYRTRIRAIRDEGLAAHVSVFKNNGSGAGASLEHVHSQLIATPFVAPAIAGEFAIGERHQRTTGCCGWCELLAFECQAQERLVFENADFVCWCPFASRYASEMCIVPRRHRASFEDLDEEELAAFAAALRESLQRLDHALPGVAFNFVLHSAPFGMSHSPGFHWHVEILPRVMGLAGFELGAGCHINTTLPEAAAAALRRESS